jgi:hypothetical protein
MNVHLDRSGFPVRHALVSLVLLSSPVLSAHAQRLRPVWTPAAYAFSSRPGAPARPSDPANHGVTRAVGGLIGAAGGFFAGAFAGAAIEKAAGCFGNDLCGLTGAAVGGVVGEGIGMGLGAAAAGTRSTAGDVLVSTGISVAGLAAALVTKRAYVLIAVPVVQLAALLGTDSGASTPEPTPAPANPN